MRGDWTRLILTAWAMVALGCASARPATATDLANANDTGSALSGRNDAERDVLRALPSLPSGTERNVSGITVTAEPAYVAASGKTCRALTLGSGQKSPVSRLACSEGQAWFFVPGVFWDSVPQE